ncbi:hypothetical protein AAVH_18435 [Aphelenchoides avenae]|nr:hypothetical protein AAVH_18435 [Aphelenchus avenae]
MRTNRYGRRYCKIVLTGGPCAGKTLAQKQLVEKIRSEYADRWQVYTVAEAASFLYQGGVQRHCMNDEQIEQWQLDILRTIFQFEDVYENIALNEMRKDIMIVCDRGGMDPMVFVKDESQWKSILDRLEITEEDVLSRYDLIIQLNTAPPEFYTTRGNPFRRENYEEAALINSRYAAVWRKHENFVQVKDYDDNEPKNVNGWEEKFRKVYEAVLPLLENDE